MGMTRTVTPVVPPAVRPCAAADVHAMALVCVEMLLSIVGCFPRGLCVAALAVLVGLLFWPSRIAPPGMDPCGGLAVAYVVVPLVALLVGAVAYQLCHPLRWHRPSLRAVLLERVPCCVVALAVSAMLGTLNTTRARSDRIPWLLAKAAGACIFGVAFEGLASFELRERERLAAAAATVTASVVAPVAPPPPEDGECGT